MSQVVSARSAVTEAQLEVKRKQQEFALRVYHEVCIVGRSQTSVAREVGLSPAMIQKVLRSVTNAPRA